MRSDLELHRNRFSWYRSVLHTLLTRVPSFPSLLEIFFKFTRLYSQGVKNTQDLDVSQNEVFFSSLPYEFDKFRILHLSDLHFDGLVEDNQHLLDTLKDLQYDTCFITGDFLFAENAPSSVFWENLQDLYDTLECPYGVYAVLGNHDTLQILPRMEEIGFRFLVNESVEFIKDKSRMTVIGIDDPHYFKTSVIPHYDTSSFSILLGHSPEFLQEADAAFVDFYLSGHTHGGQIVLPNGFPLFTNIQEKREYASGAWKYSKMKGYTSRGIGSSVLPLRFNCKPEVAIHTLRRFY
ncbi:MAG: metallophosphoesterase [Spirochaetota bacterium]